MTSIQNNKKKSIDKSYAYQADEMKAIWLQYHEPDVDELEFEVCAKDVK